MKEEVNFPLYFIYLIKVLRSNERGNFPSFYILDEIFSDFLLGLHYFFILIVVDIKLITTILNLNGV